jgi:TonB-dependent starch-binding outer membrane protein SusC
MEAHSRRSRRADPSRLGRCALGRIVTPLVVTLVAAPSMAPAQQGTIIGHVTSRATDQPLGGAAIVVLGTAYGSTSDERGRFVIRGVRAGPVTVRAQRLGYSPASQSVTVLSADSVQVNFALEQSAVTLSAVVATGTGGAVPKSELGAPIGIVDANSVVEERAATDVTSILESQVAGLRSTSVGGGVGGAKDLRIRGTSSFTLNQRPVVYIDGVRVDTRATDWSGRLAGACCSFNGGTVEDRLGDFNAEDIDHIEVLKGAAAATLYGSEASNGVIQIFTKKGKTESAPEWSLDLGSGFDRQRANYPTTLYPRFVGHDGTRALDMNKTLIGNGPFQSYAVQVEGGARQATYFVSSAYSKEVGSLQPNDQQKANVRLNVNWTASDKLSFDLHSSFARDLIHPLDGGNNWSSLTGNAQNGDPRLASKVRPYGEAWISVADIQKIQLTSDANRSTGGATINYNPTAAFSNRVTFGADDIGENKQRFFPQEGNYGANYVTNGEKIDAQRNYTVYTMDYLGTVHFQLPWRVQSTFSFGGQGFYETEWLVSATGKQFAGPGISTVTSASQTFGAERYTHSVQIGGLAQNRFGFGDRLFTTVGVRVDGNSAFGSGYGYQVYPKVDAAYNLDRMSWLPAAISSLKLRGALGTAGKAPGPFDAFQTYRPVAVYQATPALLPQSPGNLKLGPEKSTEIDAGFDAGLFNDRLGIETSVFRSQVKNAIVPVLLSPSLGFTGAQSQNIGGIQNNGWEVSLSLLTISRPQLSWRNELRLDGVRNRVTSLAGNAGVVDAWGNPIKVGYPIASVFQIKPVSYNAATKTWTGTDTAVYWGPGLPTFNLSYSPSLKLGSFTFFTLITAERGAWFKATDNNYRYWNHTGDAFLSLLGPNGENTAASDSVEAYYTKFMDVESRNNVRLRTISIGYDVPLRLASRLGFGRTIVSLAANNVMWWDHCHCTDPNSTWGGADSFGVNESVLTDPSPRTFRLTIGTHF